MSQRSRRFLAARERAAVGQSGGQPSLLDPVASGRGKKQPLAPTLSSVIGDHDQHFSMSDALAKLKETVSEQVESHGKGYLESAREQLTATTSQLVTWGREHPLRVAGAAAALIAAAGFLRQLIGRKSQKSGGRAGGRKSTGTVAKSVKRLKAAMPSRVKRSAATVVRVASKAKSDLTARVGNALGAGTKTRGRTTRSAKVRSKARSSAKA